MRELGEGGGRRSAPQSLMEVCRLDGVTEHVYGEGTHLRVCFSVLFCFSITYSIALDAMVRDTHRV